MDKPNLEILALKACSGVTWKSVAQSLGVSQQTVNRWLKESPMPAWKKEKLLLTIADLSKEVEADDPSADS